MILHRIYGYLGVWAYANMVKQEFIPNCHSIKGRCFVVSLLTFFGRIWVGYLYFGSTKAFASKEFWHSAWMVGIGYHGA